MVSKNPDTVQHGHQQALFSFLLRMGDNCLILGHRVSEWCGHAPALEEDIALANVSLDLIGQTQLWLELAAEVEGAGRTADYHFERSSELVMRLGDGSEESHRRMQTAVDALWPYAGELLEYDDADSYLVDSETIPDISDVAGIWHEHVSAVITKGTLKLPQNNSVHRGGAQGRHSEHLGFILAEMQFLQRAYPGARW